MFLQKYKQALDVIVKKPIMLWGLSLLSVVITALLSIVTTPIFALGIAIGWLVSCGMVKVYLDGLKGKEVNSDQLFAAFNKNALRVIGAMAWMCLWIVIWAMVPIAGPIIAIVKSYSYKFVPYIVMTRPDVTATQALRLSMEMTKGKKGQMFLADLCFYGGIFVVSFVLGLFSAIPFIGVLFALVTFVFALAVSLFSPIFVGLYSAAFYDDAEVKEEIPANV